MTQYYTMTIANGAIIFTPVPSDPVPPPARVLFCSPVTGQISNTANVFCLDWFDATHFAAYYQSSGVWCYHTGSDLNRPGYADSGQPVYAAAEGEIVFSGVVKGWQKLVVVIKHTLEDGTIVWTRYAHIDRVVSRGPVQRGAPIGYIADYTPAGPAGDHLHFDVSTIDLGEKPGDWPGQDKARLLATYKDPELFLKERAQ